MSFLQCHAYIQEAELIKRSFTVFKEEQSERKYWATSQNIFNCG